MVMADVCVHVYQHEYKWWKCLFPAVTTACAKKDGRSRKRGTQATPARVGRDMRASQSDTRSFSKPGLFARAYAREHMVKTYDISGINTGWCGVHAYQR